MLTPLRIHGNRLGPGSAPTPPPPPPPMEGEMLVPINVVAYAARNVGNTGVDVTVSWKAIASAVSYRVWRDNWPIATVSAPTTQYTDSNYTRIADGPTYKVSAIDSEGMESLLSTQAFQAGPYFNRTSTPYQGWAFVAAGQPQHLYLFSHHQMRSNGTEGPRVQLIWAGNNSTSWFRIYRNGVLLANYVGNKIWVDEDVSVGQTYSYYILPVALNWSSGTGGVEVTGTPSATKQITVVAAQSFSPIPIQITGFTPRHDSCIVRFEHQAGIRCYRLRRASTMQVFKYSADFLMVGDDGVLTNHVLPYRDARAIEANGLNRAPDGDRTYVLEGLTCPGPFSMMEGEMIMDTDVTEVGRSMPMMQVMHINGHGDSSNRPDVIAESEPFVVPFGEFGPTPGSAQAVFDNSATWDTPVQVSITQEMADAEGGSGNPTYNSLRVREFRNSIWAIRMYRTDMNKTTMFHNSLHPMESMCDGGTTGRQSPLHNNQAMWIMSLLRNGLPARFNFSGSEVIHATMFVDDPNTQRDWLGVWFVPSNTELARPDNVFFQQGASLGRFTFSGKGARFIIFQEQIVPTVYPGGDVTLSAVHRNAYRQNAWYEKHRNIPGAEALDRKIRVDAYFGRGRMKYYENGILFSDFSWDIGAWDNAGEFVIWFVHYFYHSSLEHQELSNDDCGIANNYGTPLKHHVQMIHRHDSRMRHWDSFLVEVLPGFPITVPSN